MVGASNSFNQIIEKDKDALMDRTKSRPIHYQRKRSGWPHRIAVRCRYMRTLSGGDVLA